MLSCESAGKSALTGKSVSPPTGLYPAYIPSLPCFSNERKPVQGRASCCIDFSIGSTILKSVGALAKRKNGRRAVAGIL